MYTLYCASAMILLVVRDVCIVLTIACMDRYGVWHDMIHCEIRHKMNGAV